MNRLKMMVAFLGIVFVLSVFGTVQAQPLATPPKVGDKAPDFTLKTHDGKSLTLSRLQGKRGVVLVFFATWCEPCMREVPHVKAFVDATRDKNILVYGVNQDQALSVVKRFVEDKKVNYRILLDEGSKVGQLYGVYAIPYIVGVDAEGTIRYINYRVPEEKERDAFVEMLTASVKDTKEDAKKEDGKTEEDKKE